MKTGRRDVLPNDYYLKNFYALVTFVKRTYADLLTQRELDWLVRLRACPEPAQRLYIRLIVRKGSTFRCSRLKYAEISDIASAANMLTNAGLAVSRTDTEPPLDLPELLTLYTKAEIVGLLGPPRTGQITRASLVDSLLAEPDEKRAHYQAVLSHADQLITLLGLEHWAVFKLCFFGNLYQDMSEFVLRDLGAVCYASYPIDTQSRSFNTREQIDAHLRYFECELLYKSVDRCSVSSLSAVVQHFPDRVLGDDHLERRLDRLRNSIARQLERLERYDDALGLYRLSSRPPARERQVRLLASKNDLDDALTLCQQIIRGPHNDQEEQFAIRMNRQLARLSGLQVPAATRYRPATTRLTLQNVKCKVEHGARDFYRRFGRCYYTENSMVTGVLGLFIWDIVFAPIPGAFYNPFQVAPADFNDQAFCLRRARLLEQRMTELDDPLRFSARIMHTYEQRHGIANPLVRWGRLSTELLSSALDRIPANHWSLLFKRMLADLRENTSGLPDLVLFPDEGGYEFIEIKGPGDALQQNQRRWMKYFFDCRIPCRVVNVRWAMSLSPDEHG